MQVEDTSKISEYLDGHHRTEMVCSAGVPPAIFVIAMQCATAGGTPALLNPDRSARLSWESA